MKNFHIFIMLFLIFLSACANRNITPYGNFVSLKAPINVVLNDALAEIEKKFSPENTVFILAHNFNDHFGRAFIEQIRFKGYGIVPFDPKKFTQKDNKNNSLIKAKVEDTTRQFVVLSFTLIPISQTNFFVLSLKYNEDSVHRAYFEEKNAIFAAGPWTYEKR